MARLVALALVFLIAVSASKGDDTTTVTVTVTITKRTPMVKLSPTGVVVGVSEPTVGTKFTLVNADGGQVTLQDTQGTHYRIALASTDYSPPANAPAAAAVASPPTNAPAPITVIPPAAAAVASQTTNAPPQGPASAPIPAPSAVTNTVGVPTKALPMPLPPVHSAPDAPSTASSPNKQAPLADSPVFTIKMGNRTTASEMSVWPEGGLPDRPLLISAHGNGGAGPREIQGWLQIAKQHRFTIVCPSFLSSVNASHLSEDEPYLKDCLGWIKDNLKYNADNVFMVGFSGGGYPTWYLATKRPDVFRGIAFQSGNFFTADYYDLSLSRWFNKPIKLIWGSQDLDDIAPENQTAIAALKDADCKNYTTEVVPGGHHQEHQDIVVAWMEQNLAPPSPDQLK